MEPQNPWVGRSIDDLLLDPEFNAEVEILLKPPAIPSKSIFRILDDARLMFEFLNIIYGSGWKLG